MLEILKLYPNRSALFIGLAIGLITHELSSFLCGFSVICTTPFDPTAVESAPLPSNPYHFHALFVGSTLVGLYSLVYVQGTRTLQAITFAIVTLLTWLSVRDGGIRKFLPENSLAAYILAFGITSLILIYALENLIKKAD